MGRRGTRTVRLRECLTATLWYSFLLFGSVGAVAQTPDLKGRVDSLSVDIRAAPAPNADLRKSLIELRSAIVALEAKAPIDNTVDMSAFVSRADEILPIAGRVAQTPTAITPAAAGKAAELIAAAQRIDVIDPTKVVIDRATALSEALKPDNIIKTYPKLYSAIVALLPMLEDFEAVDFLKAVARRSGSLSTLLTASAAAGPPTSLDTIKALATLESAILTYRKRPEPAVDIAYAEYGDMRDHSSPRRGRPQLCDATAAMRKECQGHSTCKLPATFETALCNNDPGSFIPKEHKGAWVLFRCVDPLLTIYAPPLLPSMVPSRGNAYWIPMRSAADEFSCVPKSPSVAAKSKENASQPGG